MCTHYPCADKGVSICFCVHYLVFRFFVEEPSHSWLTLIFRTHHLTPTTATTTAMVKLAKVVPSWKWLRINWSKEIANQEFRSNEKQIRTKCWARSVMQIRAFCSTDRFSWFGCWLLCRALYQTKGNILHINHWVRLVHWFTSLLSVSRTSDLWAYMCLS